MIRTVLLAGFLGAGKTTLLKRLLENRSRTGVIINEFGDIHMDGALVRKNGIEMAELSNGSIFCACIKEDFVSSLIEMAGRDIDDLFIEASGLADPSNMPTIMEGLEKQLGGRLSYLGSICVVDANTVLPLMDVLPAITAQLEYSKQVIVNKMDLVPPEKLGQIEQAIHAAAPDADITATTYCNVDTGAILAAMARQADGPAGRPTSNTYESRPIVFLLTCREPVPCDRLRTCLEEIAPAAYRIKGFAPTDRGMMQISVSGDQIEISEAPPEGTENRIAVISRTGFRAMSAITAAIDANRLKGSLCV